LPTTFKNFTTNEVKYYEQNERLNKIVEYNFKQPLKSSNIWSKETARKCKPNSQGI